MKLHSLAVFALLAMAPAAFADASTCSCDKSCQENCADKKGEQCTCKGCDCSKTGHCEHHKCEHHQHKDGAKEKTPSKKKG